MIRYCSLTVVATLLEEARAPRQVFRFGSKVRVTSYDHDHAVARETAVVQLATRIRWLRHNHLGLDLEGSRTGSRATKGGSTSRIDAARLGLVRGFVL